jgi:hypothetical protein
VLDAFEAFGLATIEGASFAAAEAVRLGRRT